MIFVCVVSFSEMQWCNAYADMDIFPMDLSPTHHALWSQSQGSKNLPFKLQPNGCRWTKMSIGHVWEHIFWLWCDGMNSRTPFFKVPNEWTQIEYNLCGHPAAWSPLWWRPCWCFILHTTFVLTFGAFELANPTLLDLPNLTIAQLLGAYYLSVLTVTVVVVTMATRWIREPSPNPVQDTEDFKASVTFVTFVNTAVTPFIAPGLALLAQTYWIGVALFGYWQLFARCAAAMLALILVRVVDGERV